MLHEMALGAIVELKDHSAMMHKVPTMEHQNVNAVSVEFGKSCAICLAAQRERPVGFPLSQPGRHET